MLSDHERKTLREVELQLLLDPNLARAFETTARRSPHDRRRRAYTVSIVLTLALCLLMLVAGAPGTALVLAAGAGVIFMARRWDDPARPDT